MYYLRHISRPLFSQVYFIEAACHHIIYTFLSSNIIKLRFHAVTHRFSNETQKSLLLVTPRSFPFMAVTPGVSDAYEWYSTRHCRRLHLDLQAVNDNHHRLILNSYKVVSQQKYS